MAPPSGSEEEQVVKTTIEIPHPIIHAVGDIAHTEGKNIYLVGGYVRDLFLDRPGNDIDFTVEGSGVEFSRIVAREIN